MGDTGIFRTGHQVWQRANITAAATYLREQLATSPHDARMQLLYEGLLEVLDPSRRAVRLQRERLVAMRATVPVKVERRVRGRRDTHERRVANIGAPNGLERRSGTDRRRGDDRRNRRG